MPPEILAQYQSVNQNADAVAQTPFQTYGGEFVAPVNSQQQSGIVATNTAANQAQPYYGAATDALVGAQEQATPYVTGASQGTEQALNTGAGYNQAATSALAGGLGAATPLVNSAQTNTTSGQTTGAAYNQGATGLLGEGLAAAVPATIASGAAADPSQINAQAIDQYLSPYLSTVLGSESALLNQNNQQQQAGQLGNAITSGAFGGDRAGIAAANLEQQQNIANANIYSGILNTGYNNALATAQQQQGVDLSAQQANLAREGTAAQQLYGETTGTAEALAGVGQQQYSQDIGTAQEQAALGAQEFGMGTTASSQLANIGQQAYGQGTTSAAQQAALGNQLYGMGASTSQGLAGLGAGAQTAALQGASAELGAGTVEQQTQQAQDTAEYNQFLQQQSYPFQTAQFLANIAEGTGALSGSTTTTTQPGGFFSDERLKEDIEPIGETYTGDKIYKYRYKDGDKRKQIGLIAQDIEKKKPDAVGLADGYKTVDYEKATSDAAARGHFYKGGLVPANLNAMPRKKYAGGGYSAFNGLTPPGVSPIDIAAILQAQEQMYQPYASSGLYGGTANTNPYGGGSGRVPAANLAVAHLQSPGALPPLPNEMQQASDIAGLAGQGADAWKWANKQIPSSSPAVIASTPESEMEDDFSNDASSSDGGLLSDLTSLFSTGGVAGARKHYDTGGSPLPYSQEDGLDIPNDQPTDNSMQKPGQPPQQQSGLSQVSSAASGIGSVLGLLAFLSSGGSVGKHKRNGYADGGTPLLNDDGSPVLDSNGDPVQSDALSQVPSDDNVSFDQSFLGKALARKLPPMTITPASADAELNSSAPGNMASVAQTQTPQGGNPSLEAALHAAIAVDNKPNAPSLPAFQTPNAPSASIPDFTVAASPNDIASGVGVPSGQPDFDSAADATLAAEGPEYNSAENSRWGVNQADIDKAGLTGVTPQTVTHDQAKSIMRTQYADQIGFDKLPANIAPIALDTAYNQGPSAALSLVAQSGGDPSKLLDLRQARYNATAANNPNLAPDLKGWTNRVNNERVALGTAAPIQVASNGSLAGLTAPAPQQSSGVTPAAPSDATAQLQSPIDQGLGAVSNYFDKATRTGTQGPNGQEVPNSGGWLNNLLETQNLIPILTGIGAMGSAKTRSFGTALATGLEAGAQAYPAVQTQQANLGLTQQNTQAQSQTNLGNLMNKWMQYKSLHPKTTVSLQDFAAFTGYKGSLPPDQGVAIPPNASGTQSSAPTAQGSAPDYKYTIDEANSLNIPYPDGKGGTAMVPARLDRNYVGAFNAANADAAASNPYSAAEVASLNKNIAGLPNGQTMDTNGNVILQPGLLDANQKAAYTAGLIQRRDAFMQAKNNFLQNDFGPLNEQLKQLRDLYPNYAGGTGASNIAGLNGLITMLDPDGSKGLAKILPQDWQTSKNSYDLANKIVSSQIAQQMDSVGQGAPASAMALLKNAVANPALGAGARRELIVHMQAILDQKAAFYNGFNPQKDNIDDYTNSFNSTHPYNETFVQGAEKITPHFAGEPPPAKPSGAAFYSPSQRMWYDANKKPLGSSE